MLIIQKESLLPNLLEMKGAKKFNVLERTSGSDALWTEWYQTTFKRPQDAIDYVSLFIDYEERYKSYNTTAAYEWAVEILF